MNINLFYPDKMCSAYFRKAIKSLEIVFSLQLMDCHCFIQ